MKNFKYLMLAISQVFLTQFSSATEPSTSLSLVFDPQTKKYFIGGGSKLSLKPSQQTGLVERIEYAMDNDDYHPYNQNVEFKSEGKHTLKFRALNAVSNWSPVQFVEVFVDLTPPSSEVKYSDDWQYRDATGLYLGTKSTVTLSAQDNLSGVAGIEYSFDGTSFLPYTAPLKFEKSGKQVLYYRSFDRVGNIEPTQKIDFIADNTPPNTELKLSGNPTVIKGQSFLSDSVSFALNSMDDLSKVKQTWVVVDGKKPQLYIKPLYFLEDGAHTLSYYSVDNVGNRESEKHFSFYTISTPCHTAAIPVGKSVNMGGINYANQNFQLKLEAKENIVGLDRVEIKMDNASEFKPYLEPIHFQPGLHVVNYRSVDRAGNIEAAKTYAIHVVEAPPETKLSTAQPLVVRDGVTYSPAPNVVTLNTNSGSGVGIEETWVSINDAPYALYKGPLTVASNASLYKISYKSVDKLGNEESVKTSTFHVIRATPIVDLFVTNGKSAEEQVRTQYLDQPIATEPRAPAATTPTSTVKKK